MIKYASNAFLATKVSFINEVANMCENCNADVRTVSKGMGLDKRIGLYFLNAGPGYGGSCFPKDTKAFVNIGMTVGYIPQIVKSTIDVNEKQKSIMVDKISKIVGELNGKTISILGIAFKPETDDIRESPSISIIEKLISKKANVKVYDPKAMDNLKKFKPELEIQYCNDIYSACKNSECIVIVTDWEEFRKIDLLELKKIVNSPVLIDLRNVYDPEFVKSLGYIYEGVGIK
jgi:UDPglucose 6-dehydrogenase